MENVSLKKGLFGYTQSSVQEYIEALNGELTARTNKFVLENEELKNKDIYVVGHSWGGFATVNIPYYHKDIKGILAIAPFYSINSCMKGLLSKPLWILLPFFDFIEKKLCGKYAKANALKTLKDGYNLYLNSKKILNESYYIEESL